MWRVLFLLIAAQMVWGQVVEYQMINIKTKTGDVDKSPVFTHLLNEETCFEFIQRGSSVQFNDEFAGDAVLHQIKTAINNNPHIGIIKDFDRRLRFAIENQGEKYSTDNLKFYFEETAMTDKKRKLYEIQYYALSTDELNKKYSKSIRMIKKYNKNEDDAAILVLMESDEGIYYISFKNIKDPNPNTHLRITERAVMPLEGPLEASVKEISTPFSFHIQYKNSAGTQHRKVYISQFQSSYFIQTKKVKNPETGEPKFVNYKLYCKLAPFYYQEDVLKTELIIRAEQAVFDKRGESESVESSTITSQLEFKNDDVIEVKLPDNWPPPIEPEWDTAVEHQSLIIKPIRPDQR